MFARPEDRAHQAFRILQIAFVIVAFIAGLDKCFNIFTKWPHTLAPLAKQISSGYSHKFMVTMGIAQIIVAIGLFFKPKWFSSILVLWLFGNLIHLLSGHYLEMALSEFGLLSAGLALTCLSLKYDS